MSSLSKTGYASLRSCALLISAATLPLGMWYYFGQTGAPGTLVLIGSMFTFFLVWTMLFVVLVQEVFPTTLTGAALTVASNIAGLVYLAKTHYSDTLSALAYSSYVWLLASFVAMLIAYVILFFYTIPRANTRPIRFKGWVYGLAAVGVPIGIYLIAVLAVPFIDEVQAANHSFGFTLTAFGVEILAIGSPLFKSLVTAAETHRVPDSELTERWRSAAVIVSIVTAFLGGAVMLWS